MVEVLKLVNWMRVRNSIDLKTNPNAKPLTQMKAMKLLYYMQAASLVLKNKKLFNDDILHWQYGPVVRSVHNKYNGQKEIIKNIDEKAKKDFTDIENNREISPLVNGVFDKYNSASAHQLMVKTHGEYPWKSTPVNGVISLSKIRNYHAKQKTFKDLARKNPYAEHPEYNLKKEIKKLNLTDNKTLIGRENV